MTDVLDAADLVTHARFMDRLRVMQQFWLEHLTQKYGLGERDSVNPDGSISRAKEPDVTG